MKCKQKQEREKRERLGRIGKLGLCVCQTKNPMQCLIQQLVVDKILQKKHLI